MGEWPGQRHWLHLQFFSSMPSSCVLAILAAKHLEDVPVTLLVRVDDDWGRRPWWKWPGRRCWLHLQLSSSTSSSCVLAVLAAKRALKMCLCNAAQSGWGRRPWWKWPGQRRWLHLQLSSSMPSSCLLAVLAAKQAFEVLLSCCSSQQPCAWSPVCIAAHL